MGEEKNKINFDKKRISRYKDKFTYFEKIFKQVEKWTKSIDSNKFVEDVSLERQFAVFHAFQILMETITDLTTMQVKDLKMPPKDDYFNIETLKEKKIISAELALKIKEANGLRNRIVHEYNGIDEKIAYKTILKLLKDIKTFKEVVRQWLKENL